MSLRYDICEVVKSVWTEVVMANSYTLYGHWFSYRKFEVIKAIILISNTKSILRIISKAFKDK